MFTRKIGVLAILLAGVCGFAGYATADHNQIAHMSTVETSSKEVSAR